MHARLMPYVLVAGGAIVVGSVLAGTSIASLLPILLLLACPVMMIFMMRGMGHGHGGSPSSGHQGCGHDHEESKDTTPPVDSARTSDVIRRQKANSRPGA